jgi:hypothetical protein
MKNSIHRDDRDNSSQAAASRQFFGNVFNRFDTTFYIIQSEQFTCDRSIIVAIQSICEPENAIVTVSGRKNLYIEYFGLSPLYIPYPVFQLPRPIIFNSYKKKSPHYFSETRTSYCHEN